MSSASFRGCWARFPSRSGLDGKRRGGIRAAASLSEVRRWADLFVSLVLIGFGDNICEVDEFGRSVFLVYIGR